MAMDQFHPACSSLRYKSVRSKATTPVIHADMPALENRLDVPEDERGGRHIWEWKETEGGGGGLTTSTAEFFNEIVTLCLSHTRHLVFDR